MTALAYQSLDNNRRRRRSAYGPKWLRIAKDVLHLLVRLTIWATLNALIASGACVVGFAMMANLNWQQIFEELANLSQHYLAAGGAGKTEFEGLILMMWGAAFFVVSALRVKLLLEGEKT